LDHCLFFLAGQLADKTEYADAKSKCNWDAVRKIRVVECLEMLDEFSASGYILDVFDGKTKNIMSQINHI